MAPPIVLSSRRSPPPQSRRTQNRLPDVVVLAVVAFRPAAAQDSLRIVALVNADIITAIDLGVRAQMIIATSGLQDTPEMRQRLKPQVLRVLIDDRLRQQAADKDGISVSQDRIDERMTQMAQNNNLTLDQFRDALLGPSSIRHGSRPVVRTNRLGLWSMEFRRTIVITSLMSTRRTRLREAWARPSIASPRSSFHR